MISHHCFLALFLSNFSVSHPQHFSHFSLFRFPHLAPLLLLTVSLIFLSYPVSLLFLTNALSSPCASLILHCFSYFSAFSSLHALSLFFLTIYISSRRFFFMSHYFSISHPPFLNTFFSPCLSFLSFSLSALLISQCLSTRLSLCMTFFIIHPNKSSEFREIRGQISHIFTYSVGLFFPTVSYCCSFSCIIITTSLPLLSVSLYLVFLFHLL